jgi:hypothetical protein
MRSRIISSILCTIFICACETEKSASIPELLDDNPKVTQISVPGISDYLNITIKYEGELIISITRPGDSIFFFYTNEQLDSARRYSMVENDQYIDEQSVHFTKRNGKIIGANFKSLNFENDTVRFRFIYNSDRLVALKSAYTVDTLLYNNETITDIKTYLLIGGGFFVEFYGELLERKSFKSYIDRPNPYYLISNRLGFPYLSCLQDIALEEGNDYNKYCASTFEIENNEIGLITGTLGYEYDEMGRIKTIYNTTKPDFKTLIKYK